MPSAFERAVNRDFAKISGQILRTSFGWKGRNYACTISYSQVSVAALELGGAQEDCDMTIQTRTALFPGGRWPKTNERLTVGTESVQVISEPLTTAGTGLLVLKCNRPRRSESGKSLIG